jgi:hypothetical protein
MELHYIDLPVQTTINLFLILVLEVDFGQKYTATSTKSKATGENEVQYDPVDNYGDDL